MTARDYAFRKYCMAIFNDECDICCEDCLSYDDAVLDEDFVERMKED